MSLARFVVTAVVLSGLANTSPAAPRAPGAERVGKGQWRAGVARVTVTPREPIFMEGYASRTRPSEGVRQDLFVKALALQDETGATSVLVTSDLHSYTRGMSDTIATAVKAKYGLPRERLILNASHTHGGPVVTGEPWLRPAEDINAEQEVVIRRYTAHLLDQIVGVIGQAIGNLAPAQISFGQGSAGFGVNRRRVAAGMRQLPGVVDQDVPVLNVRAADGAQRAIVFGYACHATSSPADYQITGDWPGYAQAALEAANPGATAMFLNGCGADCDPMPHGTVELPKMYGDLMGAAVREVLNGQMRTLSGPLTPAFGYAEIPFQTPPTKEELQQRLKTASGINARHAKLFLSVLERDGKIYDHYPYPIQVWRFGPPASPDGTQPSSGEPAPKPRATAGSGLTLIALGGEPVVDYALRFKAEYGWEDTWVAGYSNDVMGYAPSLRVLNEGGYEVGSAMLNYGRPGPLGPGVEEAIAGKVAELAARAGVKK